MQTNKLANEIDPQNEKVRLNKYLALNLGISRREADNYISNGRVKINENTATLGDRVDANNDVLLVDNKKITNNTEYLYLTLNKPKGYVCSRKQQGSSPTIYELLPTKYSNLKTVGRLDKDSSGLIIMTNDGDFAFTMTHPKFYKTKKYNVRLDKDLEPLHQQMISDYGITLADGPSKLTLERIHDDNRREWHVTMHEGRNRQIRRTFDALGYEVKKLHRTNFGRYSLDTLESGKFQELKKFR